jgi:hypothetical protein
MHAIDKTHCTLRFPKRQKQEKAWTDLRRCPTPRLASTRSKREDATIPLEEAWLRDQTLEQTSSPATTTATPSHAHHSRIRSHTSQLNAYAYTFHRPVSTTPCPPKSNTRSLFTRLAMMCWKSLPRHHDFRAPASRASPWRPSEWIILWVHWLHNLLV